MKTHHEKTWRPIELFALREEEVRERERERERGLGLGLKCISELTMKVPPGRDTPRYNEV